MVEPLRTRRSDSFEVVSIGAPGNNPLERADLVAALEQAVDGIMIADVTGKIQYVNPAITAMTGYTSGELAGECPRILQSGRHPVAFFCPTRPYRVSWSPGEGPCEFFKPWRWLAIVPSDGQA